MLALLTFRNDVLWQGTTELQASDEHCSTSAVSCTSCTNFRKGYGCYQQRENCDDRQDPGRATMPLSASP